MYPVLTTFLLRIFTVTNIWQRGVKNSTLRHKKNNSTGMYSMSSSKPCRYSPGPIHRFCNSSIHHLKHTHTHTLSEEHIHRQLTMDIQKLRPRHGPTLTASKLHVYNGASEITVTMKHHDWDYCYRLNDTINGRQIWEIQKFLNKIKH